MTRNDLPRYLLPELTTPEQTSEGFLIVAQRDMFPITGNRFSVVFFTIVFFIIFFIIPLRILKEPLFYWFNLIKQFLQGELAISDWNEISFLGFFYLLRILFFVVFFILLSVSIYWTYTLVKQSDKFDKPGELLISKYPLQLGSVCQIHYRRPLKAGITLPQNGRLKANLLCSEVVTYTVGTDDTTVRQIIFEKALADQTLHQGTSLIEFEVTLEIPHNSIPSFQSKNNQILWVIEVKLDLPGLIPRKKNFWDIREIIGSPTLSTFAFVVDPEMVES
jgi:hypothetical protein